MKRCEYEVIVVGSGFGGLCMGVKLKQAGIDAFLILEKDAEFGGTWWANTYPGCAVDIPSHLYSFSFAQNAAWSRRFAHQGELLAYTRDVVAQFDLAPHIRTNTALLGARFDEADGCWTVRTSQGELRTKTLVTSLGGLSRPSIPSLPGIENFSGKAFHSSRWDHGIDLRGKRVAVIGTGASAIQFVPEIAPEVAQLDLYQRTPPWILPRPDRIISDTEKWLLARVRPLQWLYRGVDYVVYEAGAIAMVYFPSLLGAVQRMAKRHLARQVPDPVLRAKLTPDYTFGCKRVLLQNTYYPALMLPHVSLLTEGIGHVSRDGIVGRDGVERPVDVIIYGTGFDVGHAIGPIDVRGRGGKSLQDAARDGLQAYKGCSIAGFPNFFMVTGPNTGTGHNSMIYMIESAADYVLEAVKTLRVQGLHSVEVNQHAQTAYNALIQRRLKGTVWSTGCKSWYLDRNGRNGILWPGFTFAYRRITRRFDIGNYAVRRGDGDVK
ncbi:MAG: NAD(P)/FAD-dependent oxidoreductase [Pseudomonadota bacterium]